MYSFTAFSHLIEPSAGYASRGIEIPSIVVKVMIAYISIKILEYKILQILVKLLFIGNYEQESQKILKLWLSHLFSGTKCTYFKRVVKVLVTQPCLTHCNPMDCSPPVSSIRGILQARILEWVAIRFSRGSS